MFDILYSFTHVDLVGDLEGPWQLDFPDQLFKV